MLLSRLAAGGISEKCFARNAQLGTDEAQYFIWDDLPLRQQPSRIPQDAELKRKTDPVLWPSPILNEFDVVIGQNVVAQHLSLGPGQIK